MLDLQEIRNKIDEIDAGILSSLKENGTGRAGGGI